MKNISHNITALSLTLLVFKSRNRQRNRRQQTPPPIWCRSLVSELNIQIRAATGESLLIDALCASPLPRRLWANVTAICCIPVQRIHDCVHATCIMCVAAGLYSTRACYSGWLVRCPADCLPIDRQVRTGEPMWLLAAFQLHVIAYE